MTRQDPKTSRHDASPRHDAHIDQLRLKEGRTFGGLLGLHSNPLKGQWKDMANKLGVLIIELGKECLFENVTIKMELSPTDEKTKRKQISGCGDCRWDKRSSGRRYDSISGCSVLIGCRSQLVLGIEPMSNTCSKCTRNLPHEEELCPKNVNCSSKGMEAIGSSRIVEDIFDTHNAYIHEYVGDDDSSTKKVLRHSWKEEMEAGLRDKLPRYEKGKKKAGQWSLTY
jgi:hypothetical protein